MLLLLKTKIHVQKVKSGDVQLVDFHQGSKYYRFSERLKEKNEK